jgi:16S rRNA processing protein RimM
VHGDVKVAPLAPPSVLAPGRLVTVAGQSDVVERCRTHGRWAVLKLAAIASRETAGRLRGEYLLVPERDLPPLPEGQYYRFQLLGLRVASSDGRDLGAITDILSTPENDVYVVTGPAGEVLVPAVDDVVLDVDLDAHTVTIEIVPGLLP